MFLLFDSVLPVMRAKYEKMGLRLTAMTGIHTVPSGPQSSLASLCPIFNGSVKGTEYWDVLSNANANSFDLMGEGFFGDDTWMQQLDSFGEASALQDQNTVQG